MERGGLRKGLWTRVAWTGRLGVGFPALDIDVAVIMPWLQGSGPISGVIHFQLCNYTRIHTGNQNISLGPLATNPTQLKAS